MRSKPGALIALLAIVGAAGFGWWLTTSTRPAPAPNPTIETAPAKSTLPAPPSLADSALAETSPAEVAQASPQNDANGPGDTTTEMPAAGPLTAGDILAEPDDDHLRVAKKLAALVRDPTATMETREEALAHTLNLSAGNEAEVLTPLVTDPTVPDPFAQEILAEALNRPLSYQADLYLAALAARPSPEMQTLIREHLAFLTNGEDLGSNPSAWKAPLEAAKKEWGADQ